METKLLKKNKLAIVPAGIIEGTEAFFHNSEKWVIHEGAAMRFHDAPGKVQRMIADAFLDDKQSREYLTCMGVTEFSKAFEWWYRCVVGGLDHVPDFMNGKFTSDQFNNSCNDYDCPHRGRFCSVEAGLKNYEVKTIEALKEGKSIAETAVGLCVSVAGLKSRIEKIKGKLNAPNMAAMMAKATEKGI